MVVGLGGWWGVVVGWRGAGRINCSAPVSPPPSLPKIISSLGLRIDGRVYASAKVKIKVKKCRTCEIPSSFACCPRSLRNCSVNSLGRMNIHAAVDTRKKRKIKKSRRLPASCTACFPRSYTYMPCIVRGQRSARCSRVMHACMQARTASPSLFFTSFIVLFCFFLFSIIN